MLDALDSDEWDFQRTNLLLSEFNLPTRAGAFDDPSLVDCLTEIDNDSLIQMASVVLGLERPEVVAGAELPPDVADKWKPGYLRVFLSHSAKRKAEVAAIADELAVVGIHGFVAHDSLEYSLPWQEQIESALRSMQAFVALVHPEMRPSPWCHQEIGWAMGRRTPYYAVRIGADPTGFLGREQWPSIPAGDAKDVAEHISTWIAGLPELGGYVVDGLIRALGEAGNYYSAEAAAQRIAALGALTDEQFSYLNETWWSNDQLHGGYLPTQVMWSFYAKNGRSWPPPKPSNVGL